MARIVLIADRLRREPARRMHRKERVRAQILPFRLQRPNHSAPVVGRDSISLLPLANSPMAYANVSGHFRDGFPAIEQVIKGFHAADSEGDNKSRQVAPIIPVTRQVATRTIRPMGRGTTPTKFKTELAERLRAARIAAGYATQLEFAHALGVPIERYKKWETGRTPMPHQYIPVACELLGQDANYFFRVAPRVVRKAG